MKSVSKRWVVALIGMFLLILTTSLCHAQYSASVQGTVTDPAGAVLTGVTVTLTNTATNQSLTATSSVVGAYHFENLLPGNYRIEATASGFEKAVVHRHISTNEVAGVNISMVVGGATTTIEVTAAENGLNPDETRLQYTLESNDMNSLPLPGRTTTAALRVAPGVSGTIEIDGIHSTNVPLGLSTPSVSANGRPSSSNLYLLDRIPITSSEDTGAPVMVPNTDMLAEMALQTTTFSAENGATSSLQVDMTSRSGANQYHGDVDYTYSSKPLEANPDFGSVAPFHQKYLLASVGGPILKDRTFFFASVERIDNLAALGGTSLAFDAANAGAWVAKTFPDNPYTKLFTYPASGLTSVATVGTAADYYPADGSGHLGMACGTASTFNMPCDMSVVTQGQFNQNPALTAGQYDLRFDHAFHQNNDRVYASYFSTQQNSQYIDPRPAFNTTTPSQTYFFSTGWSHTFSPNLTNQFNAGLNRFWFGSPGNPNYNIFPTAAAFLFVNGENKNNAPGFLGSQESPGTPYLGNAQKEHFFALRDYVTLIRGHHALNIGFQSQIRNYWVSDAEVYSRPQGVEFTDMLDMMQGKPTEEALYTISAQTGKWIGQYYGAQEIQYAAYVQDSWKLRPNLQLTLGIRWDDFGNPSDYGQSASPYSNTFFGQGSTLLDRVNTAYAKIVKNAFTDGQRWNFLPRAALSWSPDAVKNLVVRGGIGLYQDALSLSDATANLPTTTPVRLTVTLDDASEYCSGIIWCGTGAWQGKSATAGLPAPFQGVGTQGASAPYGFVYPTFTVTGFTSRGTALGPNGLVYSSDMYGVDPKLKPASTTIWTFGIEKGLPNSIVLSATYTGSYSFNQLLTSRSYNAPPGSALSLTVSGYVAKPWSQAGNIAIEQNLLSSNYNALILSASQRKGNASWQANYTYSHALGNPTGGDNPNVYTATAPYGTLAGDVRQRLTVFGSYELPGGQSFLAKGWSLGGVFIGQNGTPFTVYSNQDVNEDGNKNGTNDLPDVSFVAGSKLHYGKYSNAQWKAGVFTGCGGGNGGSGNLYDATNYPTCPFRTVATPNTKTLEGNEPYNAFLNPGYWDVDLNLQKKIDLPWFSNGKSHLILRFEAMNALNHANLNGFGTSIVIGSTTDFGQAISAANPRIMQIGGRFEF
jgi:hypothetical protein